MFGGLVVIAIALYPVATLASDPPVVCGVANKIWVNCSQVSFQLSSSYDDCLSLCTDTGCTHFTFFPSPSSYLTRKPTCLLYQNCTEGKDQDCGNCVSGQSACGNLECYVDKCCKETSIDFLAHGTLDDCREFCNANNCSWFSYINELEFCMITESCTPDDLKEPGTCTSGQKGCQPEPDPVCNEDSCCLDEFLRNFPSSESTCIEECAKLSNCKWYSFVKSSSFCFHYSRICRDKIEVDTDFCTSGDERCYETGGTTTASDFTISTASPSSEGDWMSGKVQGSTYFISFTSTKEECYGLCLKSGEDCQAVSFETNGMNKCTQFRTFETLLASPNHVSKRVN